MGADGCLPDVLEYFLKGFAEADPNYFSTKLVFSNSKGGFSMKQKIQPKDLMLQSRRQLWLN